MPIFSLIVKLSLYQLTPLQTEQSINKLLEIVRVPIEVPHPGTTNQVPSILETFLRNFPIRVMPCPGCLIISAIPCPLQISVYDLLTHTHTSFLAKNVPGYYL